MASFTEYIKTGFSVFGANAVSFIGGMFLIIAVAMLLIVISVLGSLLSPLVGTLLVLIALIAVSPLSASLYGMTFEAVKTGKTKIGTILSTFREKWVTLLCIELVIMIIIMIPLLIAMLVAAPAIAVDIMNPNSVAAPLLSMTALGILFVMVFVMFLLSVFLCLALPAAICDGLSAMDSLKRGFAVARAKFFSLLVILLCFAIISGILGLIPLVGGLIAIFVIAPAQAIALTAFYLDNKAKK